MTWNLEVLWGDFGSVQSDMRKSGEKILRQAQQGGSLERIAEEHGPLAQERPLGEVTASVISEVRGGGNLGGGSFYRRRARKPKKKINKAGVEGTVGSGSLTGGKMNEFE